MALSKYNAPKIAIALAAFLTVSKGIVGVMSGSLAVIGSAFDSLLDIFASSMNFIMVRKADAPPDKEHPFGHGKYEAYASLLQSVLIFGIGIWLLYSAYGKFTHPVLPDITPITGMVMAVSVVISIFITVMLKFVAKRDRSQALAADALHYAVDVLANSAILLVLILVKLTGAVWLDPVLGAAIAVYIMFSAVKLHIQALNIMLDTSIPDEKLTAVEAALKQFDPYQMDFHRLRTRTDGNKIFADVHVTLCKDLSLQEAHDFINLIEASMPDDGVDIVVHPEPCEGGCRDHLNCKKEALKKLLENNKKDAQP